MLFLGFENREVDGERGKKRFGKGEIDMFEKIFEPIKIGKLELKNRLVFPAITANYGSDEGSITEMAKAFYAERAKGGVGLIITGSYAVDPRGRVQPYQFTLYDEKNHQGMRELARLIQSHGSKAAFQLHHGGSRAAPALSGTQPITSYSTPHPSYYERPELISVRARPLTLKEIREMVERYGWAARVGQELGFDAVEIHCAHAHLTDQFLSPLLNHRRDAYGGNVMARARFIQEIVGEVRRTVGPHYPIICKINASEYVKEGMTIEDAKAVAKSLEEAGADALQVSVGVSKLVNPIPSPVFPQGCFVSLAAGIKETVSIPVIAVGRILHLEMADDILKQGKADLVAIGRSLIADPNLPQKGMEGRLEEVRPCIGCLQGCLTRVFSFLPMACTVNPLAGREGTVPIKKGKKLKKVLIAGGGPAGLEAARVTRSHGNEVFLFEKSDRLGGWLNAAAVVPYKEQFKDLIEFYKHEMNRLGVQVYLNCEVRINTVREMMPDVLVIGTGSVPFIPVMKGMDKIHVLTAPEVLVGKETIGDKVVILGGGRIGCETAEFLAVKGKQVTLLEERGEIGSDMPPRRRASLFPRLINKGVEIIKTARVEEMDRSGLTVTQLGKTEKIETDSVILALGFIPQTTLVEALEPVAPELKGFFIIGDCAEPRTVLEAIYDGWRIGHTI
jgi:2,4-dienoyl-CoA reductase-like NADH-dependent reductase (Old Yellow Enzyme family)/thioredoxin reductase